MLSSADSHTVQRLIITAVIAVPSPHNYQGEILEGVAAYDEVFSKTAFTAQTITLPSALNNENYAAGLFRLSLSHRPAD